MLFSGQEECRLHSFQNKRSFEPFLYIFLIQYNKYNTIIERISTPVRTVDNIRIQIYMHMLYIHNRQKDTSIQTSIQTKSWIKYFIDRYLPCTKSD